MRLWARAKPREAWVLRRHKAKHKASSRATMPNNVDSLPPSASQIPTKWKQRLEWKPIEGAIFRSFANFTMLRKIYMFASGKRYAPRELTKQRSRKEAIYDCTRKGCHGCIHLQIRRKSQRADWWVVKQVTMCPCGVPPPLLEEIKERGPSALAADQLGVALRQDWEGLAHAIFPAGYSSTRHSPRRRTIFCAKEHCPGKVGLSMKYAKGGYLEINPVDIEYIEDCCQQCKKESSNHQELEPPEETPEPPQNTNACWICLAEDLHEWVELPCGQEVCHICLEKLVHTCPVEISKVQDVVRFRPGVKENHCYTCPFCRDPYYPWTKIKQYAQSADGRAPAGMAELEVQLLVQTPHAYQSFSDKLPAHLYIDDCATVRQQYQEYVDRMTEQQILESSRPRPLEELLRAVRDTENGTDFQRLRVMKNSNRFTNHLEESLNFLEAVEVLHRHSLDCNFLRQVGATIYGDQRTLWMRAAYQKGWSGIGLVSERAIIALLLRYNLLQMSYVGGDSDDDDDGGNGQDLV